MADLLTNFEVDDAAIDFRPAFKGGNWKQRLLLKKNRHQPRKKIEKSERPSQTEDVAAEPPRKRPRPAAGRNEQPRDGQAKAQGQREVVSSLFSYNPESKTAADAQPAEDEIMEPSNAPLPEGIESFTSLGVSTTLAAHLMTKMDIKNPTSIQKEAIPQLVGGESDAFIQSQTGSGKTLAYLLPLVQRLMSISHPADKSSTSATKLHRDSGLFAIVLAPTRELSKQISVVLESLLGCAHWLVGGTVIGGEKKKSEKARLRKGINILVATPGRLVDHLSHTSVLDVSSVRWLILDEGDRLMELGFEEDIKAVVEKLEAQAALRPQIPGLPDRRVTVLCSATMKMNVQRLGEISLKDALHIQGTTGGAELTTREAGNGGEGEFSAPAQLKQSFVVVPAKQRFVTLCALLKHTFQRRGSVMKAIVFLSCADTVEFHFTALSRNPYPDAAEEQPEQTAESTSKLDTTHSAALIKSESNPSLKLYKLHGSLAQSTRTATLSSFSRSADPGILLCTDVASRGLDLPSIDLVIEYDPAFSSEDHLHRVGRTARAGKDGRATIFLQPGAEEQYVQVLKDSYRGEAGARVARQDAEEVMKRGFAPPPLAAGVPKAAAARMAWQDTATEFQLDTERWVQADAKARELARKAYISHVRAYATHVVPERHMFDVKMLHLGHLAKAFGLRDKPGNMGRGAGVADKSERKRKVPGQAQASGKGGKVGDELMADARGAEVDRTDAAAKMRRAMKAQMQAANEFNLG